MEQHSTAAPREHIRSFKRYLSGEIDESAWVTCALQAMVRNSMLAAWFRTREARLRACCAALGLDDEATEDELIGFDLGVGCGGARLRRELNNDTEPSWQDIQRRTTNCVLALLRHQLARLRDEEESDTRTQLLQEGGYDHQA